MSKFRWQHKALPLCFTLNSLHPHVAWISRSPVATSRKFNQNSKVFVAKDKTQPKENISEVIM